MEEESLHTIRKNEKQTNMQFEEVSMQKNEKSRVLLWVFGILQGILIGVGAVLPGISGGVLCVAFGIYRPVMELLANPFRCFRTHVPQLFPVIVGGAAGFLGVSNILAFFLQTYPDISVCFFVGLIGGMLPCLMREAGEKGRSAGSWISMAAAFCVILAILTGVQAFEVEVIPGTGWYIFCGVCLAMSVIVPGMSFSTLLMPLGLYTPFVAGLGKLNPGILLPAGIGAVLTVVLLAKGVKRLFETQYSLAFHAVVGIVIAATVMIIPVKGMCVSPTVFFSCIVSIAVGIVCALALDKFNSGFSKEETAD